MHDLKHRREHYLPGMAKLAASIIKDERDYKVVFEVETDRTGKSIDLKDLQKEEKLRKQRSDASGDETKRGGPSVVIGYTNGERKELRVNCFAQKENIKAMMIQDNHLWARRPLPLNLVLYAAGDGWLSWAMGQSFMKRLRQWQINKTMLVSLRWCRMTASEKNTRRGSAEVNGDIIKLIQRDTMSLELDDILHIDGTKKQVTSTSRRKSPPLPITRKSPPPPPVTFGRQDVRRYMQ